MTPLPPLPDALFASLPPAVQGYIRTLEAVAAQVAGLQGRVRDLEARLGQDSTNSSKPPSSDPPTVKRAPPKPASGKKRGGQPGHPRHLRPLLDPTEVIPCKPCRCIACRRPLSGEDPTPERFQVVDLPPVRPTVREYQRHRLTCGHCGHTTTGDLPASVGGQDGPGVKAAVTYLLAEGRLSKRAAAAVCTDLLNVPMSAGQVCAIQAEAAQVLQPAVDALRAEVRSHPINMDETGWREGPRRAWLWVAVTRWLTVFLIRPSRGRAVRDELLGADYAGVLTADRYAAYHGMHFTQRQFCWAHLRREFQAMIDRRTTGRRIGEALLKHSDDMFEWWHRLRDGGCTRAEFLAGVEPIRAGVLDALIRGCRVRCAPTAATCRELLRDEEQLWTFVEAPGVEPTNNAAERALRHGVMWRKTSYGTAGPGGSRFVETALSVVMTCRQQSRDLWAYLRDCWVAHAAGRPVPSLIPPAPAA